MTKKRFSFSVQALTAVTILLLAATSVFAQPASGPLAGGVEIRSEGQVLSKVADIITPGAAYFIKSKGSQKVLDVSGGSSQPGAGVRQLGLNGDLGQKFIFTDAGGGFLFIRTSTGGHFVTLRRGVIESLTQEPFSTDPKAADAQKWKVVGSGEPTCFFIVNKTDETRALRPETRADNARIGTAPRDGNALQKWLLKLTSAEGHPDAATSENGMVSDCFATVTAFRLFKVKQNISRAFPEWRSVGEKFVPDGAGRPPLRSYKILEGVVTRDGAHVSPEDVPAAHFTHDLIFHVTPDPPFRYLLGKAGNVVQDDIEVEWESGLAQADSRKENPASAASIRGDSFGFYSAGHQRRDVIWNWPTADDWVHVEGIWIFDRGHPPAKTEIHPPHFVAVKRNLPDKFEPKPGQFFFATRADIFANGDGNIVWNNKELHPFAQPVKMSERVYSVILKHELPRPIPNAKLKFAFRKQKGDSYAGQPIVTVFENGSPDVPTPHVIVSVSWAGDRVPDTAVFARSLFIYWDDVPTHGVPSNFAMKTVTVTLEKVLIKDKSEGGDFDPGEYRLFADIGGRFLFLNEFTGASDIMKEGLGRAWDDTFSARHPIINFGPLPQPSGAEFEFNFKQTFEFFIPPGKVLRVSVGGWEGDYMNAQYGKIVNPYLPCRDAVRFLEKAFDAEDFVNHGRLDDSVGQATAVFTFGNAVTRTFSIPSKGEKTDVSGDSNDPNNNFIATFNVRVQ